MCFYFQQQKLQIESAVKIQAVIRSFLARIRFKRAQRSLFDQTLQRKDIQFDKEIILLLRRLLYFYNTNIDLSRLVMQQLYNVFNFFNINFYNFLIFFSMFNILYVFSSKMFLFLIFFYIVIL